MTSETRMLKVITDLTEEVTRLRAEGKLRAVRDLIKGRKVVAVEAIERVLGLSSINF